MPVPSLPLEIIILIASHADRTTLARCALVQQSWLQLCQRQLYRSLIISRIEELDDRDRDPPLLATLESCPELAGYVRKLHFDGWHRDPEKFEDNAEYWSDGGSELSTALDELYLAKVLKCCTGLRRLELEGSYLWIDDLVFTPRLVSLTFADGVLLRSRDKKPKLLAIPPIQHLHIRRWQRPRYPHRRQPDVDSLNFDNLGLSSISLFSSVTYLDCSYLDFRGPEHLYDALQPIAPQLQSLSFGDSGTRSWGPLLPLCTSVKQISCFISSILFSELEVLRLAPASLAYLHLDVGTFAWTHREKSKDAVKAIKRTIELLTGLSSLQLDFDYPAAWRADLHPLVELCKERGVALRVGRMKGLELGEQLNEPPVGTEEVDWTQIWNQVQM